MAKILIVEDEKDLATLISDRLTLEHHLVEVAHDGTTALEKLKASIYDVIVLDWMLPEVSGIDVCRLYRAQGGNAGIIMLTAKESISDKEVGFSAGADDYMTKPFELKELAMRVKAQLRRAETTTHTSFHIYDIQIDIEEHRVTKDGKEVYLMPKEFRLLEFFVRHPQRVFSSEELLSAVWESESYAGNDTVRGHITRLRKKLDSPGRESIITTVHGVGYKLGLDSAHPNASQARA
ncbi:MAG: response regulator transcription factor [Candidatus Obscuribacterales bacterium]